MIALAYARDVPADLDHNPAAFVAENRGKDALRVIAGEREGVGMAHAGRLDPHQDFSGLRPLDVDFFQLQRFAGFPGDSGTRFHGQVLSLG